jgi:Cys-rich repeat protein
VPAGDGVSPPPERIYFPVGLAVDEESEWLYVVNSDFDLQFNQGTVQSLNLDRVRGLVPVSCITDADCASGRRCDTAPNDANGQKPSYFCVDESGPDADKPCGAGKENSASTNALAPGRCAPISASSPVDGGPSLIEQTVEISAFGTDALFVRRPADAPAGAPGRLFIPVRGDSTLHWLDAVDGRLECGQADEGRCDDRHRIGDNDAANDGRGLDLPTEPFGITATSDGRVLAVTHQTEGKVSAFVNDWESDPRLESVESGLPTRPIGVAALPLATQPLGTQADGDYQASFLVAFRNTPSVHLLRFFDDGALSDSAEEPLRPFLVAVDSAPIATNSLGFDSRGIAVDSSSRAAAEAACDGDAACLDTAKAEPLDVYVANRTPPSLVLGRTLRADGPSGTTDVPTFYDNVPLTAGPSRVILGHVINAEGEREPRVFVLCFDSALIFVYDPVRRRIETEIFTGRGPYALAFDEQRALTYVGHFTDSFIGVVSLDQRFPRTYGTMITTIGAPTPPRASK